MHRKMAERLSVAYSSLSKPAFVEGRPLQTCLVTPLDVVRRSKSF